VKLSPTLLEGFPNLTQPVFYLTACVTYLKTQMFSLYLV
jgi:hypothetical protein